MNSAKLNDWMQVAGIFALVASLLFVGMQMKQEQEIALSAAYQARTATLVEFLTATGTDDVTRSAILKIQSGAIDLTPHERLAFRSMTNAGRELMQNSHYQYVRGFLDEEHWRSVRRIIKSQLQLPIAREGLLSDSVRPSFSLVVEEIERELAAEAAAAEIE
jgi:hypothetical protein